MKGRQQFGRAGHFVGADACRFHLHTHINGRWCVSTVGEWYPPGLPKDEGPHPIGAGRLYETMVFALRYDKLHESFFSTPFAPEGGHAVHDFVAYNTKDDADAGHEQMCCKYEATKKRSKT